MNIDRLRIFIAVAESRSFSRAATELYISHSTTSRAVAALEEELGVRLLERDNHSVELTGAGLLLQREGAKLLRKIDAVALDVKNAAAEQKE